MDRLYPLHSHISPGGSVDQHSAFPSLPAIITQTPSQQFTTMGNHDSHPDFLNLAGLVSEAVMEVVFVAALGFIAARKGHFSAEAQKTVANLNIFFFTPCLSMSTHLQIALSVANASAVFSKLAKQLSSEKLIELWIIPVILFVQTIVSWVSSKVLCRVFGIRKKPQSNFVTAMAVS
jgi:predicted permease